MSPGRSSTGPPSGRAKKDRRKTTPGKRRGRPPGSVSLTRPMWETIVAYIRGGGFDHAAAQAVGVSVRTFQDWMARGEGRHPTRPSTPKLRAFAKDVNQAKAQARIVAETAVFRERPGQWLKYAARSEAGQQGWSELPAEPGGSSDALSPKSLRNLTDEELDAEIRRLEEP